MHIASVTDDELLGAIRRRSALVRKHRLAERPNAADAYEYLCDLITEMKRRESVVSWLDFDTD